MVQWLECHFISILLKFFQSKAYFLKNGGKRRERRKTRDSEDCVFPAGSNHARMTDHAGIYHITVIMIIYIYREFNFLGQR